MKGPRDILLAFALLTRLPLPRLPDTAFDRQARAVWSYPLVGLVIGAIAGIAGLAGLQVGMPPAVAAGLVLATQMLITGAMHEDGLADMFDGFWGGYTPERRLQIMRDSQIGTFGVLALIITTGLRWLSVAFLLPMGIAPIVAAAILSRALMPAVMSTLRLARPKGLSATVGRPQRRLALASLGLALVLAWALLGTLSLPLLLLGCGVAALVAVLAQRKIGGQTGDVLGATQLLSETVMLVALLAVL